MGKIVELDANVVVDTKSAFAAMQRIEDAASAQQSEAEVAANYLRRLHNIPEHQASTLLQLNTGYCVLFGDEKAVRSVIDTLNKAVAAAKE